MDKAVAYNNYLRKKLSQMKKKKKASIRKTPNGAVPQSIVDDVNRLYRK